MKNKVSVAIFVVIILCVVFSFWFFICSISMPVAVYVNIKNDSGETLIAKGAGSVKRYPGNEEIIIKNGQEAKILHSSGDIILTLQDGTIIKYMDVDILGLPKEYRKNNGKSIRMTNGSVYIELQWSTYFIIDPNRALYVLLPRSKTPDKEKQPNDYPKIPNYENVHNR